MLFFENYYPDADAVRDFVPISVLRDTAHTAGMLVFSGTPIVPGGQDLIVKSYTFTA